MNAGQGGAGPGAAAWHWQGMAGANVTLQVQPTRPMLGSLATVQVGGLTEGWLLVRPKGAAPVRHTLQAGQPVKVQVAGPLQLMLLNASEQVVAWALVQPRMPQPAVLSWGLPASVPWSAATLHPRLQLRDCHAVQVRWRRVADGADSAWSALPDGGALPLPAEPCHIELEAALADAAATAAMLAPIARQVVEVTHPEPEVLEHAMPSVQRHQEALARWTVRWVAAAQLELDGQVLPVDLAPLGQATEVMVSLPTGICGVVRAVLCVQALDGNEQRHELVLEVQPRRPELVSRPAGMGRLLLELSGAEPLALVVPDRRIHLPLRAARVWVDHGFLLPTLAQVQFRDDLGHIRAWPLTLGDEPCDWADVQTFSELGWR